MLWRACEGLRGFQGAKSERHSIYLKRAVEANRCRKPEIRDNRVVKVRKEGRLAKDLIRANQIT